jgi:hypothetical protein
MFRELHGGVNGIEVADRELSSARIFADRKFRDYDAIRSVLGALRKRTLFRQAAR